MHGVKTPCRPPLDKLCKMGLLDLFMRGKYERDVNRMIMKRRAQMAIRPVLLKYSLLLYVIGLIWIVLLPLDIFHDSGESDDRSLLVGQVAKHFSGADVVHIDTLNADLWDSENHVKSIEEQFMMLGLDISVQNYTSIIDDTTIHGQNIHGILRTPRGEGVETIVISAPWRTANREMNRNGIHLLLDVAKYYSSTALLIE